MGFRKDVQDYSNSSTYHFIERFNSVAFGWFYRLLVKLFAKK